jgi:hypothetical protein
VHAASKRRALGSENKANDSIVTNLPLKRLPRPVVGKSGSL